MFVSKLFLLIMFLFYNYLVFELVGKLLENPILKKKYRVILCIANSVLAVIILNNILYTTSSFLKYLIFYIFLFAELYLFHRDCVRRILFVASACLVHVMAIRAIVCSIIALKLQVPIHFIILDKVEIIYSTAITFFILNVFTILVLKFIPLEKVRIINQHDEQLCFMNIWLVVANIFWLINARIYNNTNYEQLLLENQSLISILLLFWVYLALFFTIKTGDILGYKEKNEELKKAIHNEQQYRESITSDAISVYEFNLTKDIIVNGMEEYWTKSKQDQAKELENSYTKIINTLAKEIIHPDDLKDGLEAASLENFIREFNQGRSETVIEYRRLMLSGKYIWVRATTNVVKDIISGELIGFTYIKDINMEKQVHLTLQYNAERDSLTGLYNKGITAQLISDYLSSISGKQQNSVLLIIDVDNFKSVNDHLGHTFGDAVLSDLSAKLTMLFRSDDIIGRIGGDEFIAFLKNVPNIDLINIKATDICVAFRNTYKGNDDLEYSISASVGIARYPLHGKTFEELYKRADIALYSAKNKGKNTYEIYNGQNFSCYESNRTEIDNTSVLPQKNFTKNRMEYVFKILFGSDTSAGAIYTVLELLASNYNFSRGYIFETSEDGLCTSNTFEWCSNNIEPHIQNLQDVPIISVETSTKSFYNTGRFILEKLNDVDQIEREVLEPQGIKSMLQFGIFEKDKLMGFIGFDDCQEERTPSDGEVEELSTICNILASFIVKQRVVEKAENHAKALSTMMNNLNSFAFIINKSNYKFLFTNDRAKEMFGSTDSTDVCYQVFRGEDKPCIKCPLNKMGDELKVYTTNTFFNRKFNTWVEASFSNINWIDGKRGVLVSYRIIKDKD